MRATTHLDGALLSSRFATSEEYFLKVIESKQKPSIESSEDYGTDLPGLMMTSNKEGRGKAQKKHEHDHRRNSC